MCCFHEIALRGICKRKLIFMSGICPSRREAIGYTIGEHFVTHKVDPGMRRAMVEMMQDGRMRQAMADIMSDPGARKAFVDMMAFPQMSGAIEDMARDTRVRRTMENVLQKSLR